MSWRNHDRKLVQWTAAYVVAAVAVLQASDLIVGLMDWPPVVLQTVLVLVLFGLLAAIVIAWFHGEKGRQKVSGFEALLIAVIVGAGLTAAMSVARSSGDVSLVPLIPAGELNLDRYALLPFEGASDATAAAEAMIRGAVARWNDVEVVDPLRVEAVIGAGERPHSLAEVQEIGRELGAAHLILGEATRAAGTLRLRVVLHDVRTGQALADTTLRLPQGSLPTDEQTRAVAERLMFGALGLAPDRDPGTTTTSFHARVAFLEGLEALDRMQFRESESRFAKALRSDPSYARAHLWRAIARHWDDQRGAEILAMVRRALASGEALTARERSLGVALEALEREEFAEACDVYRSLQEIDVNDFAAWYGLGTCRSRDARVLEDPTSPTGWRFRSSYHRAAQAFQRAFELVPTRFRGFSPGLFDQARTVLYAELGTVEVGRAASPETDAFAAYPTLQGDTLAFLPYPVAALARGDTPDAPPEDQEAAAERQRRVLNDLADGWLVAFPEDPQALRAYALTLDLMGDPRRTLDTLASLRSRTEDPEVARQLALVEVPRLVKYSAPDQLERLRMARAVADSLLAEADLMVPSAELAAVAAMTGRIFLAATLERRIAEAQHLPVDIPAQVMEPAGALAVYATLGVPEDSLRAYERRVLDAIANRIPAVDREVVRHRLLDRPAALSFLGSPMSSAPQLAETTNFFLLKAMQAWAEGRTEAAEALLPREAEGSQAGAASSRSLEVVLGEAWLYTRLGHLTRAADLLDRSLGSLAWLDAGALDDVVLMGALVRAMAMRADLAIALGDDLVAARWARAVVVLWDGADPPLQPLVSRMRRLTRVRGRSP